MLELIVNGTSIPLYPDTKIPVKLLNPMFNEQGSHSFQFDIPNTPPARRVFAYPERVSTINHIHLFPALLTYKSNVIFTAELAIQSANKDRYRGFLCIDNGSFKSKIKGLNLTDINTPVFMPVYDETAWRQLAQSSVTSGYPDCPYVFFPFYNNDFHKNDPWPVSENKLINTWGVAYYYTNDTGRGWAEVPFFYVHAIINYIFNSLGYTVNDNLFINKPELNKLILFNIKAPDPNYINWSDLKYSAFFPPIDIKEFLNGFFNSVNGVYFVDENSRSVHLYFKNSIIQQAPSFSLNQTSDKFDKEIEELKSGYKFEHNQPDPDTYFKSLVADPFLKNNLYPPVDTVAALNTIRDRLGAIRYVNQMGYYYIDTGATTQNWVFYSPEYILESGKCEYEHKSGSAYLMRVILPYIYEFGFMFSSVFMGEATGGTGFMGMKIPRFDLAKEEYDKVTKPIFLFYRGMQAGSNPILAWTNIGPPHYSTRPPQVYAELYAEFPHFFKYPWASFDVNGPDNAKLQNANLGWHWSGQYGLFENFWSKWVYWYQNRRQSLSIYHRFSPQELAELKPWNLLHIDGANCLFSEITGNLASSGFEWNPTKFVK